MSGRYLEWQINFWNVLLTVTVATVRQNTLVNNPRFQLDHSRACHDVIKTLNQYLKHYFNSKHSNQQMNYTTQQKLGLKYQYFCLGLERLKQHLDHETDCGLASFFRKFSCFFNGDFVYLMGYNRKTRNLSSEPAHNHTGRAHNNTDTDKPSSEQTLQQW